MKKIKAAIFISDVGYGHMVRQREVIRQLLKNFNQIEITVINVDHIEILKETFGKKINYKKRYNNITLYKNQNSFFDLEKSQKSINKWPKSFPNKKKLIKKIFLILVFLFQTTCPRYLKLQLT